MTDDQEKLAQARKTIRSALRGNILHLRFSFEDHIPAEVASYPDEILLDLYIEEIAGMLNPARSALAMIKNSKTKTEVGTSEVIQARRQQQEEWT